MQLKQKQDGRAGIKGVNLRQELDDWFKKQNFKTISFKENQNPLNEPTADYRVVYEARFIPDSTSQAGLELTLTDGGYLGVGIETRKRIAERLKVRNPRDGFADGFEPSLTEVRALLLLLDVVSAGELVIQARLLPWHRLGQTRAITTSTRQGADAIFARFYFANSLRVGLWTKTLTFGPWD